MLNLKLRDEFLGPHMPGTAIALRRPDNTGAAQQSPDYILSITYPTADVQSALRAVSTNRAKRPVALLGDRGRGKSHIMAVMHHAIASPERVEAWAREWGDVLGADLLKNLRLERGFVAISEPVHNHEFPLLWDLLFERHPKGAFFKGRFQQMGHPYPPRSLLEEMFEAQPVALILDEFQKWFDGLSDQPGAEGIKYRTLAENFIQNLSELSKDRPEVLILVVSVLNSNTEAFRQVHRVGPALIDFRGATAKQDRQKLLLYRLFQNRGNIPGDKVRNLVTVYATERFRLRFSHLSEAERARIASEVADSWPFAPELLELLEDHILMAEAAQETRDLIRILAQAYRSRGERVPLITPADFFVDDDSCGVQSLLDSIATVGEQERLRAVAQRNLEIVQAVGAPVPHARELISALWIRSMSPGKNAGATRQELHLDITRDAPVDDNAFQGELVQLIESSINIHGEERADGRMRFGPDENRRSKVRSTAKNHKLWQPGADAASAGHSVYPYKDLEHIQSTLRHILSPETRQPASRVVVLGPKWATNPWGEVEDVEKPDRWDRPVLVVIPEPLDVETGNQIPQLGDWLAKHVPSKRNTVRFLLPAFGSKGIYQDEDLAFSARCSYLTSIAWKEDPGYRALKDEFDRPLRDALKKRFDRFAVLRRWDFPAPHRCIFDLERLDAQGGEVPSAVEDKLLTDLFDPAEFQSLVLERALHSWLVGDLMDELSEAPPPDTGDAIPFLGETILYEEILKVVAKGNLAVNVSGTWIERQPEHASDQEALQYVRSKAFRSGQEMRAVRLGLPGAAGSTTVTSPGAQASTALPGTPIPALTPAAAGAATDGAAAVATATAASPAALLRTSRTEDATGINLSGCFEKWGIPSEQTLAAARIEFKDVTVQQMKIILQRFPSSLRASLEVSYSQEEPQ